MPVYTRVADEPSLERFLEEIDFGHDAIVRELAIAWRGYVDKDGLMWGDAEPHDGMLIIHSQNPESPVIEVVLEELYRIRFNPIPFCQYE